MKDLPLERTWTIDCTRCANEGVTWMVTRRAAHRELVERGWTCEDDGTVFCPACNGASK